ncbi:unnamed protein product [Danaus chrysippus]|uniref:(African queen) hypothetical protein n=1 Tax=Danaus chrysippus TaxID=151541 RepID=A0A8J2VW18_9NEOP|nr:unnamed protein product [Danaus chrysippus]
MGLYPEYIRTGLQGSWSFQKLVNKMASLRRLMKKAALYLLFAFANLIAVSEGQLTFSSGWGKRSQDDEIAIDLEDQLQ